MTTSMAKSLSNIFLVMALLAGLCCGALQAQTPRLDIGPPDGWLSGLPLDNARAHSPDGIIDRIQERQAVEAKARQSLRTIYVGMTRGQLLLIAHPHYPFNESEIFPQYITPLPSRTLMSVRSPNINSGPPLLSGVYDADRDDRVEITVTFRLVGKPQRGPQGQTWTPNTNSGDIITMVSEPYLVPDRPAPFFQGR